MNALNAAFAADVLAGLSLPQKRISSAWLYDRRGSELFEEITGLPEYYPTRTEIGILETHAQDMARPVGPAAVVVEIGSGSSRKTPLLLRALDRPHAYIPLDLAEDFLLESARTLAREFVGLRIVPLVADFTLPFDLPADLQAPERPHLGFFPGSTIGNLSPFGVVAFLRLMAAALGEDALMLIGTDCTQDPAVLLPAYDDAQGVTAAFNLNLLARINRELGGDFDLNGFTHQARYRPDQGRIEMHLVSRCPQQVRLCGQCFAFAAGETIHTENSHKYSQEDFRALAHAAGWHSAASWSDRQERFRVHRLHLAPSARKGSPGRRSLPAARDPGPQK